MKKTRVISGILAVCLLAGCGKADEAAVPDSTDAAVSEESAVQTEAESLDDLTETVTTVSENRPVGVYSGLFTENKQSYMIAKCSDGTYTELTEEEYYELAEYAFLRKLMAEDEVSAEDIKEVFGITPDKMDVINDYICFIAVECEIDGENADLSTAAEMAFSLTLKRAEEQGTELDGSENPGYAYISLSVSGDAVQINANIEKDNENVWLIDNEYFTLDGKSVFALDGKPVSSDTKSLYISAYDETRATMIDGGASEEYDRVIFDLYGTSYSDDIPELDIAELADNLPDLEKLYVSAYIKLKNTDSFAKLGSLRELQIDVGYTEDISALSEINVDKLYISGVDRPVGGFNAKELCIECEETGGVLESIFKLKNVTELTVGRYGIESISLSGIENLTELKKLDISANGSIDISPLGKLKKVEDLKILAYEPENLDSISNMSSVKKLMLHSKSDDDLSFLSKMTGIEELSLMYVNSSFGPALKELKRVKRLAVSDISDGADMSRIYDMENLEELIIMGERVNTRGIEKLGKLKTLKIMLCSYNDLSGLKKCGSLESLVIYNCDTPEFDAKDIEGMTSLHALSFSCSQISHYEALKTLTGLEEMKLFFCDLSADEVKEIKKALPDCIITDEDGNELG